MGAAVHPLFTEAARPLRHATGDRWSVDETYVKVAGRWRYLYRAVDQYGQAVDVITLDATDPAKLGQGTVVRTAVATAGGPVTYLGDAGETTASVLSVAEQLSRPGVGSVVATGSQTNGDFGLFRGTMAAGTGVSAHFHRTFSESFYVLTGAVELWDGITWSCASAGDLVHVPRGGVHGLRVPEGTGAEVLTIFTPGIPRERFVLELLEIRESARVLTPEQWTEFYRRHDQYMV